MAIQPIFARAMQPTLPLWAVQPITFEGLYNPHLQDTLFSSCFHGLHVVCPVVFARDPPGHGYATSPPVSTHSYLSFFYPFSISILFGSRVLDFPSWVPTFRSTPPHWGCPQAPRWLKCPYWNCSLAPCIPKLCSSTSSAGSHSLGCHSPCSTWILSWAFPRTQ